MQSGHPRLLDIDAGSFNPWRIAEVTHRLGDHPLLQSDSLIALAERLEQRGGVRSHGSGAQAGTSFNHAPVIFPNKQGAAQTIANLRDAKAWTSLLNVQTDTTYRGLVDEVLDDVKPLIDLKDPGMCYRGGWIFLTSPNTVTPFHMDKEHNFIMQISGRKTLYVWEPDDRVAVSEEARDLFHAKHSRDLVTWREEFRQRARVFHLLPGMGAYMPSTSPHLVENGPEPSITVSFTYYTHSTRRNSALHSAHQRLRDRGMAPAPVGERPTADALAYALWRVAASLPGGTKRSSSPSFDGAPYAHAAIG
jgi:hypothetical protein